MKDSGYCVNIVCLGWCVLELGQTRNKSTSKTKLQSFPQHVGFLWYKNKDGNCNAVPVLIRSQGSPSVALAVAMAPQGPIIRTKKNRKLMQCSRIDKLRADGRAVNMEK